MEITAQMLRMHAWFHKLTRMNDSQHNVLFTVDLPRVKQQGWLNDAECNTCSMCPLLGQVYNGYMDLTTSKRTPTHLVTLKWFVEGWTQSLSHHA